MYLLRVTASYFVAGAVWQEMSGTIRYAPGWYCVRAAPIIQWMVGMTPEQAGRQIRRKGWRTELIRCV